MRLIDLHPTALAELRCPPSLPSSALADLSGAGFCVVPGWLSAAAAQAVLLDAMSCEAAGLPRRAGVGSTRSGATAVRQDQETRRSSMLPLYPPPRQSAGLVDVRRCASSARSSRPTRRRGCRPSPLSAPSSPTFTTRRAAICVENKVAQTSASGLSRDFFQRQSMPQAALELWPASAHQPLDPS